MASILRFLRLIRVQNLLIIAGTLYLMRWCVVRGLLMQLNTSLEQSGWELGLSLQMSELDFFLLALSTVMIAAAGNIINDYFDLKIDRVNKPDKIIVGRHIKRRVAMGAHVVINFLGILIGAYVAWKVNHIALASIHVFAAVSLWYYATTFKRQLVMGNLIIAVLAGVIPLVVGLFEVPLLNTAHLADLSRATDGISFNWLLLWLGAFGAFAFTITLAREITKDAADIKGDEKYGCISIPIKYGIRDAKLIVIGLYALIVAVTLYLQVTVLGDFYTLLWALGGIAIPLLYTSMVTWQANDRDGFNHASKANKMATLGGILGSVVVYFQLIN